MTTVKGMVSVLIPAKNEVFLAKTIQDILQKAKGEIEIIVHLDNYWPTEVIRYEKDPVTGKDTDKELWRTPPIVEDPRVIYIHRARVQGSMRAGINACAAVARGEFLMKSDAHCMYDEGFDEKLKADIPYYEANVGELSETKDNWIVIPRRNRLDAEHWTLQEVGKPPVDYEYLSSPSDKGVKGNKWDDRTKERMDTLIDETMSFQGSCWFMTKNHYVNTLGGMSEEGYGGFVREAQEIGLKTFLSDGRLYTNKKTWYAHLHKGPTYGRMYFLDKKEMTDGDRYCDDFWFNNRWTEAKRDMAWLIERFMPVPTWTPELIEQVRKK